MKTIKTLSYTLDDLMEISARRKLRADVIRAIRNTLRIHGVVIGTTLVSDHPRASKWVITELNGGPLGRRGMYL